MNTLPEPAASRRLFRAFRNRSKSPQGDAVITPITPHVSTKSTPHFLAERLSVVLNDLGLLPHVPSDWLQPRTEVLAFRPLTVLEANRLVLAVEDLAQAYESPRPAVNHGGQLTFYLGEE